MYSGPGERAEACRGGFALVIVIVIMLLLSFLAGQLILNVSTELKIVYNKKKREKELGLAQAGVNLAIFRLLDEPLQDLGEEWESFEHGYEYEAYLPIGRITYMATNESGKINLNHFDGKFLRLFLEYMQLDAEQQRIVIDSLLDWQDNDDLHRLNGAEKDYYEELSTPYIPRNGKIMDPSEFFLVKGTEELIGKFKARDVFTVYSRGKKIDFNNLSPVMLDFLVQGDEEKKNEYYETRQLQGRLDSIQARRIMGDARFEECAPYLTYASTSRYYTIISRGEAGVEEGGITEEIERDSSTKTAMEIYVLLRKQGSRITYLAWEEDLS